MKIRWSPITGISMYWNMRVAIIPTLSSMMAAQVVITTTCVATIDDKVGIMITLHFQCTRKEDLYWNRVLGMCNPILTLIHWNRKVIRMTALLITGDIEGKLQRLQWWPGQSPWQPFRFHAWCARACSCSSMCRQFSSTHLCQYVGGDFLPVNVLISPMCSVCIVTGLGGSYQQHLLLALKKLQLIISVVYLVRQQWGYHIFALNLKFDTKYLWRQ